MQDFQIRLKTGIPKQVRRSTARRSLSAQRKDPLPSHGGQRGGIRLRASCSKACPSMRECGSTAADVGRGSQHVPSANAPAHNTMPHTTLVRCGRCCGRTMSPRARWSPPALPRRAWTACCRRRRTRRRRPSRPAARPARRAHAAATARSRPWLRRRRRARRGAGRRPRGRRCPSFRRCRTSRRRRQGARPRRRPKPAPARRRRRRQRARRTGVQRRRRRVTRRRGHRPRLMRSWRRLVEAARQHGGRWRAGRCLESSTSLREVGAASLEPQGMLGGGGSV